MIYKHIYKVYLVGHQFGHQFGPQFLISCPVNIALLTCDKIWHLGALFQSPQIVILVKQHLQSQWPVHVPSTTHMGPYSTLQRLMKGTPEGILETVIWKIWILFIISHSEGWQGRRYDENIGLVEDNKVQHQTRKNLGSSMSVLY
jgi:hypothetical protein